MNTFQNINNIDLGFDSPHAIWKAESLNELRYPSPSDEKIPFPPLTTALASSGVPPTASLTNAGAGEALDAPNSTSAPPTLDERFEGIMLQVEAAGFESFDDLVTAYYSNTFGDASLLATEQHLSRNRRLPKVIADVFRATSQWTPWERRGFHEEILKTAEGMLIAEGSAVWASLLSDMKPLLETLSGAAAGEISEALVTMKKLIQNEVNNEPLSCSRPSTDFGGAQARGMLWG